MIYKKYRMFLVSYRFYRKSIVLISAYTSSETRIFTFILYNNYDTPYLHHKHIYLHLYYTATYDTPYLHHKHIYLHLYYTATTIPHIFITDTRIFTFILYNNYDNPYLHHKHIYLHLYYTATYDTPYLHHRHTHIYIYTIQQLR